MIDFTRVNTQKFIAENKIKPCPFCERTNIRFMSRLHNEYAYTIFAYCPQCYTRTRENIGETEFDEFKEQSRVSTTQFCGIKASQRDVALLQRAIRDWNSGFVRKGEYINKR